NSIKKYEVISTSIIYRGPYGAIKGNTVSLVNNFRPVDLSDGLNFYAVSDTHDFYKHVNTDTTKLDFIILGGDHASFIQREEDLLIANKLGRRLSNGEIPLLYARGNHETKGSRFAELYQYVGSKGTDFFYSFYLNGVAGVVLDMVEDYNDSWYEFYGMADYTNYRLRQLDFLDDLYSSYKFEEASVRFRLAISHVPITVLNKNDQIKNHKELFTESLNRFNLNMLVSGHKHILVPVLVQGKTNEEVNVAYAKTYGTILKNGSIINANFNAFIISKRTYKQGLGWDENEFGKYMIGMITGVSFINSEITISYINNKKEVVPVLDPYSELLENSFTFEL
ncbi:MAG: metallophosphoesterase, partial [Bacillales bacterium]|nr:metallophosphoesterase [Bacillales bacterium]